MEKSLIIQSATVEEKAYIYKKMREYNAKNIPLKKEEVVEGIFRVIKDSKGNVIAGITGYIHHNFKSIFINLLWVKEEFRKCCYGTMLLENVEKEAFEKGVNFVHLGTLGFQAKDFYAKKGYEVFAVLGECVLNNKMYYMKKKINNKSDSLKMNCIIENATNEEANYIGDRIVEFNSQQVPFTNELAFEDIEKVLKDSEGNVIAGIATTLLPWSDLEIHGIWVSEDCAEKEFKVKLLNAVEKELIEKGGHVAMLEIFDIKAKDFYIENGYEVYGILAEYPDECKCYYMKKIFY
jgi:N-acetylglutamate synthase-like GNAT family acetyltransferase